MMKKIFMMAIAFMAAMSAHAQNEEGVFTIMPKAGLNLATLTDDPDASWRPSYVVGFEAEYGVNEHLGLVAGIQYSDQGCKDRDDAVPTQNEVLMMLGYVNVPLMVQYYPVKGLALKAGAQLGYLSSKKAKIDGKRIDIDKLYVITDTSSDFRNFDLSIPMGISYEYANFVIDARYNLGLIGIFKDESKYKNSVFQFTIGYKLPLGK